MTAQAEGLIKECLSLFTIHSGEGVLSGSDQFQGLPEALPSCLLPALTSFPAVFDLTLEHSFVSSPCKLVFRSFSPR